MRLVVGMLAVLGVLNWVWLRNATTPETWIRINYALMGVLLALVFGCFHGTEEGRRGGYRSFPARWFVLPLSTAQLVAWPMVLGVGAVSILACRRAAVTSLNKTDHDFPPP